MALRIAPILVGGVLLGLGAVTVIGVRRLDLSQVSEVAKVGEWFFAVTVLAQLSMVLLAARRRPPGPSAPRWPAAMFP